MQHFLFQSCMPTMHISHIVVIWNKGLKKSIMWVESRFFFVYLPRLYFSIRVYC